MKRWLISAFCGAVTPLAYAYLITVFQPLYYGNDIVTELLIAPVMWPWWLYSLFFTFRTQVGGWATPVEDLVLYLGNFILYTLLTYGFLKWRNIPKKLP